MIRSQWAQGFKHTSNLEDELGKVTGKKTNIFASEVLGMQLALEDNEKQEKEQRRKEQVSLKHYLSPIFFPHLFFLNYIVASSCGISKASFIRRKEIVSKERRTKIIKTKYFKFHSTFSL